MQNNKYYEYDREYGCIKCNILEIILKQYQCTCLSRSINKNLKDYQWVGQYF